MRRSSVQGINFRRGSIHPSQRRGSMVSGQQTIQEVPWDLLDRLLLPLLCCHAAAIIVSGFLNWTRLCQVNSFALFIFFTLATTTVVWFYHHLKVSIQGKAILVTGCETPLAWYLAKRLDELGFAVFAGFTKRHGSNEADVLKEEGSGRMKILPLDVTSETQMLEASLFISKNLPDGTRGLWAVIHCATWIALGELEWVPFDVLRKSIDINLLGAARLTQIMLPLVRRCNGRLVFLSSALSRIPAPVRGAQCATQAGLEGLANCLRQELRARGVDVSIVAVGEYAAGTAWLSDKSMAEQAEIMWSQLSKEQINTYGKDHFEHAIRSLERYTKVDADLGPAVSSLIDAVTRTFPLARYTPVTRAEKIQTFIAEHFPQSVYEKFYCE